MAKGKKNRVTPIPKDTDILLTGEGGKHRGWMWKDIPTSSKQWYLEQNWWSEKKFKSMTDFEYCKYFIESNNKMFNDKIEANNKELEDKIEALKKKNKELEQDFDELSNRYYTIHNKFEKLLSTIDEIDSLLLKNKQVSQFVPSPHFVPQPTDKFVPQPTDSSYQNGIYRTLLKNN